MGLFSFVFRFWFRQAFRDDDEWDIDSRRGQQMIGISVLQGRRLMKTWHCEPALSVAGTCRRCWRFDGDTKPFTTGRWFTPPSNDPNRRGYTRGQILFGPPAHPNCRCRLSISWDNGW